jgi:hypothetical protein
MASRFAAGRGYPGAPSARHPRRARLGSVGVSPAPLALTVPLAVLLLLLAVPSGVAGYRGRIGTLDRAGRLGLHTPAAIASEKAFALANRVAAPLMIGAAGVGVVCGLLVLLLPMGVAGAVMVAVLGLAGVLGQWYAASTLGERAASTVPRPARKPGSDGASCCGGCGDGGCAADAAGSAPSPTAATGQGLTA